MFPAKSGVEGSGDTVLNSSKLGRDHANKRRAVNRAIGGPLQDDFRSIIVNPAVDISVRGADDMSAPCSESTKEEHPSERSEGGGAGIGGEGDEGRDRFASTPIKQEETSHGLSPAHSLESGPSFEAQAPLNMIGRGMVPCAAAPPPAASGRIPEQLPTFPESLDQFVERDEVEQGRAARYSIDTFGPTFPDPPIGIGMLHPFSHPNFPEPESVHRSHTFDDGSAVAGAFDPSYAFPSLGNEGTDGMASFYNPYHAQQPNWAGFPTFNPPQQLHGYGESMDRKPTAIDTSFGAYPQQAPTGYTFPMQDASHFEYLKHPSVAAATTATGPQSNTSSTSSSSFLKDQSPRLKRPPPASAPGETTKPTAKRQRRTRKVNSKSQRGNVQKPSSRSRGRKGGTRKQTKTATGAASARGRKSTSSPSSSSSLEELEPLIHYEPTQEETTSARTPRKQDALRSWYNRLNDLCFYKRQYGHCNIPQKYSPNHALGIWVNKQRMEKKAADKGEQTSMTQHRIQLLESVGFVWAKKKGQHAWQERFEELCVYQSENGDCNVPTKNNSNRALGRWVSTQRSMYKKYMAGQIEKDHDEIAERIKKLKSIGFVWSLAPGSPNSNNNDAGVIKGEGATGLDPQEADEEEEENDDEADEEEVDEDAEGDDNQEGSTFYSTKTAEV